MDTKTEQLSLSDNWRENRSTDKGQDLASILESARVMAQSLIPNVNVTFAGIKTARTDKKTIELSAKYAEGPSPLSGHQVDRILGLTVHEVGHCLFSEDKPAFVQNMVNNCGVSFSRFDRITFEDLIDTQEDMYVNHVMSGYPGYKDYLQRQLKASAGEHNSKALLTPLKGKCSRQDMLNALGLLGIFGIALPADVSKENLSTLQSLLTYATLMVIKKIPKEQALRESWAILRRLPQFVGHENDGLFKPPKPPKPEPQTEAGDNPEPGDSNSQGKQDADKSEDENADDGDSGNSDRGNTRRTPDDAMDRTTDSSEPEADTPNSETAEDETGDQKTEEPVDGDEETREDGESEEELDAEPQEDGQESDSGEQSEGETTDSLAGDGTDDSGDREAEAEGLGADDSQDGDHSESDMEPEPVDDRPSIEDFEDIDLARTLDEDIKHREPLDTETAAAVQQAITEKSSDLSELISHLAKDSPSKILAYTPAEDASRASLARQASADAEEKTRKVLQEYRLKRTRDYRGLEHGRVSTSRLYRAGFGDTRVFQRRERPDEINLAVALCMDLSGSTQCYRNLIDQIVVSLTDAFSKEKIEFIALGYSHKSSMLDGGTAMIPKLYDKESGKVHLNLENREVWGGTPSYEGLAAAIAQLMRLSPNKQKLLIHFTDGEPNQGQVIYIPKLLADARKNGIMDIHVCLGGDYEVNKLKLLYGDSAMAIQDIKQLPGIINQELRRKLQI